MKFEQVLNNAEQNKHYQTKFGGNLLFCEMRIDAKATIQKVVITGEYNVYNKFGKIKEKRVLITNLTTMEEYKATNSSDLIWISAFCDRINWNTSSFAKRTNVPYGIKGYGLGHIVTI